LHHQMESIERPTSLQGAWDRKAEGKEAVRFLGGGIDLQLYSPATVRTLVDLSGLGLAFIQREEGLVLGTTTTMTEAIESDEVGEYADGFLREVLRQVASPLQRNLATFGGTLGSAHPWSDVIPAFLVLDAELTLFRGSEETVRVEEYYAQREAYAGGLITKVRLPALPGNGRCAFETFTRTAFDVAMLNVACCGAIADGRWEDVRIAVGGTPALATRLRSVETGLVGAEVTETSLGEASAACSEAIEARDDLRATGAYRRTLARQLVHRALLDVAGLKKGDGA